MNKVILLVDDDADDRELFCEALGEAAPELLCQSVSNGKKAITGLNNYELKIPDLIFLDVNMPVMNGWELLKALKKSEAFKNIPVIMYSTTSHSEEIEKAREAGALCFFTKPRDFGDLRSTLEIVIKHLYKRSYNEIVSLLSGSNSVSRN